MTIAILQERVTVLTGFATAGGAGFAVIFVIG
jgi:hypothetical protein